MNSVTPNPIFCPVPSRHSKLAVIAVSDGSPSRGECLLNNMWRVNLVDVHTRKHVNRTAEGAVGIEGVDDMPRRSLHAHKSSRTGPSSCLSLANSAFDCCQGPNQTDHNC